MPDLIREQLLKFLQAPAGSIDLGFDLYRKNIILPLNQEIHLIGRIALAPVPGDHFKRLPSPKAVGAS